MLLPGFASTSAPDPRVEADRRSSTPPAAATGRASPSARAAAWCGTAAPTDRRPNVVAGNPVHWIYAIPSDGADRFGTYASLMQADAQAIDAWWRTHDATRTPRNDLAAFACGAQLDISFVRFGRSGSQLAPVEDRFGTIVEALMALEFSSLYTKYLIYYDGPVDANTCGQGASDRNGLGFAVVYVQACAGVPLATTAAHEVLHTLGAVSGAAPNECPEPDGGHVCDDELDVMYPFGDETPLAQLPLDTGRDDYYGHSGTWTDTQDSAWLVQLDRQVPFSVSVSGPGSVAADVPGLECGQPCTTTWNAGTPLAFFATPAPGAKLVRWGAGCTGRAGCSVTVAPGATVSALFAPARYRLAVTLAGRGTVRSSHPGISCKPRCSALVSSYETLRLTATPAKGWRFRRWAGGCRGTRASCSLPMTANTSARAVFVRRSP